MLSAVRRLGFRAVFILAVGFLLIGLATIRVLDPAGIEMLRNHVFDRFQVLQPRQPRDPVAVALLRKGREARTSPFPGRTYPTGSVTGMPSAV